MGVVQRAQNYVVLVLRNCVLKSYSHKPAQADNVGASRRFGCVYGVWSMEYRVWSMEYRVWSMEYRVWSMEYRVWSMEYRVWSMEYRVVSPSLAPRSLYWALLHVMMRYFLSRSV